MGKGAPPDGAMRAGAALLLALYLRAGEAHAGAWTLDRAAGQIIFSFTAKDATQAFDAGGGAVGRPTHRKRELAALVEYGATDWLTLIFSPTLERTTIGAPTDARYRGPGYTEFGARARLLRTEAWVGSVQVLGRVAGASDAGNPAEAGKTEHMVDARVLLGRSVTLWDRPGFLDLQAGYRVPLADGPGEFRLEGTAGLRLRPGLLLMVQSFNALSDGGGRPGDRPRRHEVELSAVWDFGRRWSVQIGGIATVAGRETLKERGLVAAVWHRF